MNVRRSNQQAKSPETQAIMELRFSPSWAFRSGQLRSRFRKTLPLIFFLALSLAFRLSAAILRIFSGDQSRSSQPNQAELSGRTFLFAGLFPGAALRHRE